MNAKEIAEAQALIDSVKQGTGPLRPATAVFPLNHNDTVEYWKTRAETAELKILEFSKVLDQLRVIPQCRNPNHACVDVREGRQEGGIKYGRGSEHL
jgi:hypothetical protein